MRAHVSMNLFGKLRKRNAMRGLPSIYVALSLLIVKLWFVFAYPIICIYIL